MADALLLGVTVSIMVEPSRLTVTTDGSTELGASVVLDRLELVVVELLVVDETVLEVEDVDEGEAEEKTEEDEVLEDELEDELVGEAELEVKLEVVVLEVVLVSLLELGASVELTEELVELELLVCACANVVVAEVLAT